MKMRPFAAALLVAAVTVLAFALPATAGSGGIGPLRPTVGKAVAFDKSAPLRELQWSVPQVGHVRTNRPEFGVDAVVKGNRQSRPDGALQGGAAPAAMPAPLFTFEGPSNQDNFDVFGFRVNPPDSDGDVGRNHYVAMINLVYSIYTKTGTLILGPVDSGTLWADFPIDECTEPSGDPIVLYDEKADRWILTQFTTRGLPPDPPNPFYNCVAVSQTPDPTGAYYRYAFTTDDRFPDYPKYGIWPVKHDDQPGAVREDENAGSVTITTREFAAQGTGAESIGIYALNRAQLLAGDPNTQVIEFQLTGPPNLRGDGLLPADFDGKRFPHRDSPQLIVGSQDNDWFDGATFDALNVFQLRPDFDNPAASTFTLRAQLATAPFDSNFPCNGPPGSRDCLPQPGITNTAQYLDILSYRQRPTWRLQYRNLGSHESLVTNQSVEARPGQAGVRWYELRHPVNPVIYQQGTYAPNDGVHRWMGSAAMDQRGNIAVGFSVVNATNVFPGIRYAGRRVNDPLGTLAQGEAVMQAGSGVQTTTNSRWGDYTSLNIDPSNDCTFYYINEYYTFASQQTSPAGWLNRVGAFRFNGCS